MSTDQETGAVTTDDVSQPAPLRRFSGSCHCGAVHFEASLDLSKAIACNCSICATKGLILAFTPTSGFALLSGEDKLKEYRFNRHVISHLFCAACGVESFARGTAPDGAAMVAVNVRALHGIDLAELSPTPFNGRTA